MYMNRMEEYDALLAELETVPDSDPVGKARRRVRRRSAVRRSATGLAAVLLAFVGLINVSPAVSAACQELPLIRELVELLTFNPSLRLAVENDYIQMVGQEQNRDGITARVEYLIVDQKQVNIFYTLTSEDGSALDATPEVRDETGEHLAATLISGGIPEQEDDLRKITVDFVEENVPEQLRLTLLVRDVGSRQKTEPVGSPAEEAEPEPRTSLTFELRFDPKYTAQGRIVPLNQIMEIDGQRFTLTQMEIYPTHLRLNISEDSTNTAWLKSLHFYLELSDGSRVETISNGISATGSSDTRSMVSYRAESTYFYDADSIRLIVIGADLLDRERETVQIDLGEMTCEYLPEGVSLHKAERTDKGLRLSFLIAEDELSHSQLLGSTYYDAAGNSYTCNSYSCTTKTYDEKTEETYYLDGFYGDILTANLLYSRVWKPESPLVIELSGGETG